jgi:hypothetical protein
MRPREASSEEMRIKVKMHFLLADAFKVYVEKDGIPIVPFPRDASLFDRYLDSKYLELLNEFRGYKEEELDEMIGQRDPARLERYNSLEWRSQTVSLDEIGPWPGMDEIDVSLTTGNVPETVERVMAELKNPTGKNIPVTFIPKIKSITRHIKFINPYFPIILFPGGLERVSHNDWVRTSGEVPLGEQEAQICKIFLYDNDAGNSRAFAYSKAGIKEVGAYVGSYR